MKEKYMHLMHEECWCNPEKRRIGECEVTIHRIPEKEPEPQLELSLSNDV